MTSPLQPTPDRLWTIEDDGFALAREHEVESVLATGNGLLGIRASVAEGCSLSDPATFVAGVYDVEPTWNGIPGLLVLADWTDLGISVEGTPLSLESGEMVEHRRVLDLRHAVLWRDWVHRDADGRVTRVRALRFASLADRNLAVQRVVVTPDNYTGIIRLDSRLAFAAARIRRWSTAPTSLPRPTMRVLSSDGQPDSVVSGAQTATTGRTVRFAIATAVNADGRDIGRPRRSDDGKDVRETWECGARLGEPIEFTRFLVVDRERSADQPTSTSDSGPTSVVRQVQAAEQRGWEDAAARHAAAWDERWDDCDVQVQGDDDAQRALRFAMYHLVAAANPEDPHVSVGARALTGEAYRGHVFWDTEIYLLPFYTYTYPAAARSLLQYRHVTLPGARRKAEAMGYRGALYAWESTDTGDETTPTSALTPTGEVVRILTGEEEHHISGDVAYAAWQYWQVSGDDEFFVRYGAELILETARFWASRGRIESDGCYHIRRVIGPDEYHETIDDDAFTNVMARWNLVRGAETAAIMADRWPDAWQALRTSIGVSAEEIARWREVADAMKTGFDRRTSLFEQFDGYFGLEDLSLAAFEPRTAPIDIILQRDRLQKSKIIKQADVVALSALLWDEFPRHVHESNFRYYEPRTAHGSSLSPALHAMIAARLGDDVLFHRFFRQAAEIDLANNMGNAAGGVHIAALGGLWLAAVLGVGGLRAREDGLVLDPHLPRGWAALSFNVQWHGRRVRVSIDRATDAVTLALVGGEGMHVALECGETLAAQPGSTWRARRARGRWNAWERVDRE
ncbi:MAG: glycoside hydrolase family 65 protein [Bacteroidales bacterium]